MASIGPLNHRCDYEGLTPSTDYRDLPTEAPRAEGLFVHNVSRTSEFDPNVFLLGETIPNAENSFGVV